MALEVSGELHIKGTLGDPTRSIENEVENGISGEVSLTDLQGSAEPSPPSLPVDMTDFYGFEQRPANPSNIGYSYVAKVESLTVTWNDNSNNEDGFDVQVSKNSGTFLDHGGTPAAANATQLPGAPYPTGNNYQGRVRSFNGAGSSSWIYGTNDPF